MLLITTLAVGAAIGLIISTTGVGGGVIVLPVLTYFWYECINGSCNSQFIVYVDESHFVLYAFSPWQYSF